MISLFDSITNPNIKFSNVDNSLHCRLEDNDQKSHKKFASEEEQQAFPNAGNETDR